MRIELSLESPVGWVDMNPTRIFEIFSRRAIKVLFDELDCMDD